MFKDKEEVQLFNHINSHDSKTPIERALKLAEECGEVAEAMLSAQEVSGSSYKDKDYSDVIKECIDVIIVAKSIIASVVSGIDPQITMETVNETYGVKMDKWQEKCSVPPMEDKKDNVKVFCYKKYEEDPIGNSYETKKILDGMIIHLEDGNTDILNVYHSGRDGVITLHGKDMYVHEDWIVPQSEFEYRIAEDTLVVDIQKWKADMRHIDEVYHKLDGVEVCRHDIGNWYEVEYEGEEYNVHRDWLTPYGEFIKRKWGK